MTGSNLSDVQELALLVDLREEAKAKDALEDTRFRSMILALHLDRAKKILDVLDDAIQEDEGEYALELSEEEMASYQPVSTEEADEAIAMLRRFGVAVQD